MGIKKCFTSRFGDEGFIMEADFSQLEVIGAALVSGDPMMKKDILDGVDSHSQSASWLHPQHTYEEIRAGYLAEDPHFTKMRKNAKAPRFELQYGARAPSIARNNKLPLEVAQGFIDRYYDRYSTLKAFQDGLMRHCESNLVPSSDRLPTGHPAMMAYWQNPYTKRRLNFQQQAAPEFLQKRDIFGTISPTQVANYPMQSFATGDVMPEVIGAVGEAIWFSDLRQQCLPINTVHDSIIFDVHESVVVEAGRLVKNTMESAPELVKKRFGEPLDLPFPVDVEYGRDWEDIKHLDLT